MSMRAKTTIWLHTEYHTTTTSIDLAAHKSMINLNKKKEKLISNYEFI